MNHREYGTPARMLFLAGQERGIRISYIARAKAASGQFRSELVRHAREANQSMVRFIRASQEIV